EAEEAESAEVRWGRVVAELFARHAELRGESLEGWVAAGVAFEDAAGRVTQAPLAVAAAMVLGVPYDPRVDAPWRQLLDVVVTVRRETGGWGSFEVLRSRHEQRLESVASQVVGSPEQIREWTQLLWWAYPMLPADPQAFGAYLQALALFEVSLGLGDGEVLTEGYLRDVVVPARVALWGMPDMEFGEALRMVLEEAGRRAGAVPGLARFDVGAAQRAAQDQAEGPALFRPVAAGSWLSGWGMAVLDTVFGADIRALAPDRHRLLAAGADALERLGGGDPLAAAVGGGMRIDAVARRVLHLADGPVSVAQRRELIIVLGEAVEAGRAGSLAAVSGYYWQIHRFVLNDTTRMGYQQNPGIGRTGTRTHYNVDMRRVRAAANGEERDAPWGRYAYSARLRLAAGARVEWGWARTRKENVVWADWLEVMKHDPRRIAPWNKEMALFLTATSFEDDMFAVLMADTLSVTVDYGRTPLDPLGAATRYIAHTPVRPEGSKRVVPRTVAAGGFPAAADGTVGIAGLVALQALREEAGDTRGLTWAGVRAVVSAYYEVRGEEMPAFGVALEEVLAAAVGAVERGEGLQQFLPVDAAHPLAVPQGGMTLAPPGQHSHPVMRHVLWLWDGGQVTFEQVRGIERKDSEGRVLALSSLPEGYPGVDWKTVAGLHGGEVLGLELGGGSDFADLGAADGSVLRVDWEDAARYFDAHPVLRTVRGRGGRVVVGPGAGLRPGTGPDPLEYISVGQALADAWQVWVGILFDADEAARPGAVTWFRPALLPGERVSLAEAGSGWQVEDERFRRWEQAVRLLAGAGAEDDRAWYLRVLNGLAKVEAIRQAQGDMEPLTLQWLREMLYEGGDPQKPLDQALTDHLVVMDALGMGIEGQPALLPLPPQVQPEARPQAPPRRRARQAPTEVQTRWMRTVSKLFARHPELRGESSDDWVAAGVRLEKLLGVDKVDAAASERFIRETSTWVLGVPAHSETGRRDLLKVLVAMQRAGRPAKYTNDLHAFHERELRSAASQVQGSGPEQVAEWVRLLRWAYPGVAADVQAYKAYLQGMALLDAWFRRHGGRGELTEGHLRDLVHGHLRAWGVPDMEFGEGLRMVLEGVGRLAGVDLQLARFDVGTWRAGHDRAEGPALFRAVAAGFWLSGWGMAVLDAVFGAELRDLAPAQLRLLAAGADALERLGGGDPLVLVDGVSRIDTVARGVLQLDAGEPVTEVQRQELIELLGQAVEAGRADSQIEALSYYWHTFSRLFNNETRMGSVANPGIGRSGRPGRLHSVDMKHIRLANGREQDAPWGRHAFGVNMRVSDEGHVYWLAKGTSGRWTGRHHPVAWAEWAESFKYDPQRIAPYNKEVVLFLTEDKPHDTAFARLLADWLAAKVTFGHATLKPIDPKDPFVSSPPQLASNTSFESVEPRTVAPEWSPSWAGGWLERPAVLAGLDAVRELRAAAGDMRELTWAGVRAVVNAYYEVRVKPVPPFGMALVEVMAAAVGTVQQEGALGQFLTVPGSHPLAVPAPGRALELGTAAQPLLEEYDGELFPLGDGPAVPFAQVRAVEMRRRDGRVLGVSVHPDGPRSVEVDLSALVESLGGDVFVLDLGAGAAGPELALQDGSALAVNWQQTARYFLALPRAREAFERGARVLLVGPAAFGVSGSDPLADMSDGQYLADTLGTWVGSLFGSTAAEVAWYRPSLSHSDLRTMWQLAGVDWEQDWERTSRWMRAVSTLFSPLARDDRSWYVKTLRGFAALDEMRQAEGEMGPLTWWRLLELVRAYQAGRRADGVQPPRAFDQALELLLAEATTLAETGQGLPELLPPPPRHAPPALQAPQAEPYEVLGTDREKRKGSQAPAPVRTPAELLRAIYGADVDGREDHAALLGALGVVERLGGGAAAEVIDGLAQRVLYRTEAGPKQRQDLLALIVEADAEQRAGHPAALAAFHLDRHRGMLSPRTLMTRADGSIAGRNFTGEPYDIVTDTVRVVTGDGKVLSQRNAPWHDPYLLLGMGDSRTLDLPAEDGEVVPVLWPDVAELALEDRRRGLLAQGRELLLGVPHAGDGGLEGPSVVADTVQARTWSADAHLVPGLREDGTRGLDVVRPEAASVRTGGWLPRDPGQVSARGGVVRTLDGREIPDEQVYTVTEASADRRRTIGRTTVPQAEVSGSNERLLEKMSEAQGFVFARRVGPGGNDWEESELQPLPWPADANYLGFHGVRPRNGAEGHVKFQLTDGRSITVGPEEAGRFWGRRGSVQALPAEQPLVGAACFSAADPVGDRLEVPRAGQLLANSIGRAFHAIHGEVLLGRSRRPDGSRPLRFRMAVEDLGNPGPFATLFLPEPDQETLLALGHQVWNGPVPDEEAAFAQRVLRWVRVLREVYGARVGDDERTYLDRLGGLAALDEMRVEDGDLTPLTWRDLRTLVSDRLKSYGASEPLSGPALDSVLAAARAHTAIGTGLGIAEFIASGVHRPGDGSGVGAGAPGGQPEEESVEDRVAGLVRQALAQGMPEAEAQSWAALFTDVLPSGDPDAILTANVEFGQAVQALSAGPDSEAPAKGWIPARAGTPDDPRQARNLPTAREMLRHLQEHTELQDVDGLLVPDGVGLDVLGRWKPQPTPGFLQGHDYSALTPAQTLHRYNKLDLLSDDVNADGVPDHADMDPTRWDVEALYADQVVRPSDPARPRDGWAPDPSAPELPETITQGIPKISYSIWLGSVLRPEGKSALFWETLQESTERFPDLMFVHATQLTRAQVRTALGPAQDPEDPRQQDIRDLAYWARTFGIKLVNVHELYHAQRPMAGHRAFMARLGRRNGVGVTSSSDILRLNLILDSGGLYLDGNKRLLDAEAFQKVADGRTGFRYTMGAGTGGYLAFRGHPLFREFLDDGLDAFAKDQVDLYRDARSYQGNVRIRKNMNVNRRNSNMERNGPYMVPRALLKYGWFLDDFEGIVARDGDPQLHDLHIEDPNQGSWMQPAAALRYEPTRAEVLDTVVDVTATLIGDLSNKRGHLDLVDIQDALSQLPDPETALEAVLGYLASREDLRTQVTGFMGSHDLVVKFPQGIGLARDTQFAHLDTARRFLYELNDAPSLIGDEAGWWLLHKKATRAVLLAPGTSTPSPQDLARAHNLTRPDTFGLFQLPTDLWNFTQRETAYQSLMADPTLPSADFETASWALDHVADMDRPWHRTAGLPPERRTALRARLAAVLNLGPAYDPERPLPLPGPEDRYLILVAMAVDGDESLPDHIVRALTRVVFQHYERAQSRGPRPLGGGPAVPMDQVRSVELRGPSGQVLGVSARPDGRRSAAVDLSALVESLGGDVFVLETGVGDAGPELALLDGSALAVNWQEAAGYFMASPAVQAATERGARVLLVGPAAFEPGSDPLADVPEGQHLADTLKTWVGSLYSGGADQVVWYRPSPSAREVRALLQAAGVDGGKEPERISRWMRAISTVFTPMAQDDRTRYLKLLRGFAELDGMLQAEGERGPLTYWRLLEVIDAYQAGRRADGSTRPEEFDQAVESLLMEATELARAGLGLSALLPPPDESDESADAMEEDGSDLESVAGWIPARAGTPEAEQEAEEAESAEVRWGRVVAELFARHAELRGESL
ncbi:lonely Cys domain-containing protein, partial [Streptomyces sp. NPDC048527]|uniref:lonely Cys domain-containing protein n=1 Tax=Streptomyces sp. NPDC048527 TaxID=3365568 RepID=UPI0037148EB6